MSSVLVLGYCYPTRTAMRAMVQDGWLAIPELLLTKLGWSESDTINIEVLGQEAILTKIDSPETVKQPAIIKSKALKIS